KKGDLSALTAPAAGARMLAATYRWPVQTHGTMGPSCGVADVRADSATIWSSTQGPHQYQAVFARILGLPRERVRVVFMDGAGTYGQAGSEDAACEAMLLSRALGRPVRVQWTREDEHGWDPKGPPQVLEVRGGIDADQRIVAWETQMWLPANVPGHRPFLAVDAAGMPQAHGRGAGQITQNGDPPYAAANAQ